MPTKSLVTQKMYGKLGYAEQQVGLPNLEFMTELAPPEGLKKFRIMQRNDPVVGGLMLQLDGVMRRLRYEISGTNADFVIKQLENITGSLPGLIGEMASAFTYGFYIGEMSWAVEDGVVVLQDVEPRFQTTIQAIRRGRVDDRDLAAQALEPKERNKVKQMTDKGTYLIPYKKCLHHVFVHENRSPYGVSLLRHLYKPYFYKTAIEAAEAVGADRDLAGLPMMTAPEGFDFTAADEASPNYDASVGITLEWAINLVGNVRKDEQQGIVVPNGWDFKLLRGEGKKSIDTTKIIGRYNTEMALGVLEGFLSMGAFASTNNANVEMHVANFLTACDAYAISIAQSINGTLIKKICDYNGIKDYPVMNFSPARVSNLDKLASFVARLVGQQVITPTIPLEKSLLAIADLPYDEKAKKINPEKKPIKKRK